MASRRTSHARRAKISSQSNARPQMLFLVAFSSFDTAITMTRQSYAQQSRIRNMKLLLFRRINVFLINCVHAFLDGICADKNTRVLSEQEYRRLQVDRGHESRHARYCNEWDNQWSAFDIYRGRAAQTALERLVLCVRYG